MKYHYLVLGCGFAIITGCASMPKLDVGYYHSRATAQASITHSINCTQITNEPVVSVSYTVKPKYANDPEKRARINLGQLGSGASKTDTGLTYYADGRLKSINVSQTGVADEAIEALVGMLESVSGVVALGGDTPTFNASPEEIEACTLIRQLAPNGKPFVLIHNGHIDFESNAASTAVKLVQSQLSDVQYAKILNLIKQPSVSYSLEPRVELLHSYRIGKEPTIELIEPRIANVEILIPTRSEPVAAQVQVAVPQHGKSYRLPIQKSPLFGKNSMSLELSEIGTVTSLSYNSEGGSTVFSNAVKNTLDPFAQETDAQELANIKTEIDMIIQQQRLANCRADPINCQ